MLSGRLHFEFSLLGLMQEAKRLVEAGLPIPAYGQLLKLSHAFNILDARGAVGVTERATCFGAMRSLARQIAGSGFEAFSTPGLHLFCRHCQ
jgi:glycyl-tRNA synthetase alpha subunit